MVIAAIAGLYGVFLFAFMTRSKLVTVPPQDDEPEAQDGGEGNGTYRYAMLAVFLFSICAMLATRGIGTERRRYRSQPTTTVGVSPATEGSQ
jgi:hypothetical protein